MKNFNYHEKLKKIKALIFDIDGVLSQSVINMDKEGNPIRTTCVKDTYAIKVAQSRGLKLAIISGAYNDFVKHRFIYLGIKDEDIFLNSVRKTIDLQHYMNKEHLVADEILYMGDDTPDIEILENIGFPCCPLDAVQEVKDVCCYISKYNGGCGCVRDVIEQVLKTQNI